MGRQRHDGLRPRYGRMAVAATSMTVTVIAVLGGAGALPSAATEGAAADQGAIAPMAASGRQTPEIHATGTPATPDSRETATSHERATALPKGSGTGRRVVYSEGLQRVWLVGNKGQLRRTYLVSGSVYDNLDHGRYAVFSRSEQALGIDDSGTMRYFVRFTQGDNAAIGFHDIPVDDGDPVQTVDQLGTPQSHGCIRQRRPDAVALWDFAPLGTKVVVTA